MNPRLVSLSRSDSAAWARRGDIDAFFGLMLDNIGTNLDSQPAGSRLPDCPGPSWPMIPGIIGVLISDLIYTAMAFIGPPEGRATSPPAPWTGRSSTFGAVLFIISPSYRAL